MCDLMLTSLSFHLTTNPACTYARLTIAELQLKPWHLPMQPSKSPSSGRVQRRVKHGKSACFVSLTDISHPASCHRSHGRMQSYVKMSCLLETPDQRNFILDHAIQHRLEESAWSDPEIQRFYAVCFSNSQIWFTSLNLINT